MSVTPDGGTATTKTPYATGQTAFFTVTNTGNIYDEYNLYCQSSDSVVCRSMSITYATLNPSDAASVTVTYDVLGAATGQWVRVYAGNMFDPPVTDIGTRNITIAAPTGAPVVSVTPHNGRAKSVNSCIASCFDAVFSHTTPAYFTMGKARSLTLTYNSGTVTPIGVIDLDVSSPGTHAPTAFSFQAKRMDNGALLTFKNGVQTMYYTASGTQVNRVVLPVDTRADSLATGAHEVLVTVTSRFGIAGTDSTKVNTVRVTMLVVDRGDSPYGAGIDIPGVQHAYARADGSYMITEGDGSAVFYRYIASGTYATPAGTTARFDGTTRTSPDGAAVTFDGSGRIVQTKDRFNNTTTYSWTGDLLTMVTDPKGGMTILQYNGSNKLTTAFDSAGGVPRRTTYTVTGGQLVRITDPDSLHTDLGYDANGRLTQVTDRIGYISNFVYDSLGHLGTALGPVFVTFYPEGVPPTPVPTARVTIGQAASESRVWAVAGAGVSFGTRKGVTPKDSAYATTTSASGAVTRITLDRFMQPLQIVGPLGSTTVVTRDTLGRTLTLTTPAGATTTYTWNTSAGKEVTLWKLSTAIGGQTVKTTYQYNANLDVTEISEASETRTFGYSGRLLVTDGIAGTVLRTHYPTSAGLDTAVVDNEGHRSRLIYDAKGNLIQTVDPQGVGLTIGRDGYGRDTSFTAALAATSYLTYNWANAIVRSKDPYGNEVLTTFDALGRAVRIRDKKGQVYRFQHGPAGQVAVYDLADTLRADRYKYDATGALVGIVTRRGDEISLSYDVTGRLISRSGVDFVVDSFAYAANGRWMKAWNVNSRDSVALDQGGRITHSSQWFGAQRWGFDRAYNAYNGLISRSPTIGTRADTAGVGQYNLSFSTFGTLQRVQGAGVTVNSGINSERLVSSLTFDPFGTAWTSTSTVNKNHQDSTRSFSPSVLNSELGGKFRYDSASRLVKQDYNGVGEVRQFRYDSLGQLINYCDNTPPFFATCANEFQGGWGGATIAYKYDAAGNRVLGSESLSNVGAGNRLTTSRGWYFTYDSVGNMLTKCTSASGCTDGYRYTWNAVGQLTTVRDEANVLLAAFKYDAFGRRVEKRTASDTTRFIYDGDQILADVSLGGVARTEYSYWPGDVDALLGVKSTVGGWTGVAIRDPVGGTIQGIANISGGGLLKQYDVDPWGRVNGTETGAKTRHRLAGREYDVESGLYYNRARYYDPDIGRFISEDPIGVSGGLNLYTYAESDPVNSADAFGLDKEPVCPPGLTEYVYDDPNNPGVTIHVCRRPMPDITVNGGSNLPFYDLRTGGALVGGGPVGWGIEGAGGTTGDDDDPSTPEMAPGRDPTLGRECAIAFGGFVISAAADYTGLSLMKAAAKTTSRAMRTMGQAVSAAHDAAQGVGSTYGVWSRAAAYGALDARVFMQQAAHTTVVGGWSGVQLGSAINASDLENIGFAAAGVLSAFVESAPVLGTIVAGAEMTMKCAEWYNSGG